MKYLQQQYEALNTNTAGDTIPQSTPSSSSSSSSSGLYQQKNLVGIDLSSEMVNICRATYPHATFHHGDFLDYKGLPPSQLDDTKTNQKDSESFGLFDAVVFNECLHNFRDIENTLVHALSLVRLNGCVIVSHPRGFDNVFMQAGKNKWLCPSLLPSNKGNQLLIILLFHPFSPILLTHPTLTCTCTSLSSPRPRPHLTLSKSHTSPYPNVEWEDLATRLGADAPLVPSIKSAHYLGVMVKTK